MTLLYFSGAENQMHHQLFQLAGAERLAINVASWKRNYSKGWTPECSFDEWLAWSDSVANLDDLLELIEKVGSLPTYVIGPEDSAWNVHAGFLPLWDGEHDFPRHHVGTGLAVTNTVVSNDKKLSYALSARKREMTMAAITGKSRGPLERFDIIVSSAWWSSVKHGETQVWDGGHFHRYNADAKSSVRGRHAEDIRALGLDPQDVLADDSTSVAVLALRSWMAFEELHLSAVPTEVSEVGNRLEIEEPTTTNTPGVVDTRPSRERHVLPSMAAYEEVVTDDDGEEVSATMMVASVATTIRRCDNCFLANACPAFQPGHECAYAIPVEITNKHQLNKVLQAVLETQTARVFQSRFSEEALGQELDPTTGREMDRLFTLAEKMGNIMDDRESLRISVEARGGPTTAGSGVLSQLFGNKVGAAAASLDPVSSNEVIDAVEVGRD